MVENITASSSIPGKAINSENFVWREDSEIPYRTKCMYVDDNFFHFYNLEFLAGRQFPPNAITDTAITQHVTIINEALMRSRSFLSN
jgi:hypothetical protein